MEGAPVRLPMHQRLWRDLLLAQWSVEDIADGYGVSERTVRMTVADPTVVAMPARWGRSAASRFPMAPTDADIAQAESLAQRDLVHRFPTLGIQLEAALRAAYRRALADAGIIPAGSPLLTTSKRVLP
jgi:hypothetical protein